MRRHQLFCTAGVLLPLLAFGGATDATERPRDSAAIHRQMMHFYEKPDLKKIPYMFRVLDADGSLDTTDGLMPVLGFFSTVFHDNPDKVSGWIDQIGNVQRKHKNLLLLAVRLSDTPQSKAVLMKQRGADNGQNKQFIDGLFKNSSTPLLQQPLTRPVLSGLWSSFFASGDKIYLQRIEEALALLTNADLHESMTGESARWLLINNCRSYPKVLMFCRAEMKSNARLRPALEEVLAKVKDKKYRNTHQDAVNHLKQLHPKETGKIRAK